MASPLWASSLAKAGIADRLRAIVRTFPGAEYLATQRDRAVRDWTVTERLGEITHQTLVAVGELEMPGFVSWASEIAAAVPGATLDVFDGLGHLHLLEDPRLVSDLISRFTEPAEWIEHRLRPSE
jgi:pimeloyl-ACP methyl ester carboxylesterase